MDMKDVLKDLTSITYSREEADILRQEVEQIMESRKMAVSFRSPLPINPLFSPLNLLVHADQSGFPSSCFLLLLLLLLVPPHAQALSKQILSMNEEKYGRE